ncbi:MAG: hypothetical protein GY715_12375 [Planctomycetes bacterium]|nr:hypothetical protein [Planctomycetota bacterium]
MTRNENRNAIGLDRSGGRLLAGGLAVTLTTGAFAGGGDVPGSGPVINDAQIAATITITGDTSDNTDIFDSGTVPNTDCGESTAPDAWYTLSISNTITIDIDLCVTGGTFYDSKVFVVDTTVTVIACNDDSCGLGGPSVISGLTLSPGLYELVIDGFDTQAGPYAAELRPSQGPEPVPPNICPADLDGNRNVGFGDILQVIAAWGPCPPEPPCPEDLSGNGQVDFADILAVVGSWGPCPQCPGQLQLAPENDVVVFDVTPPGFYDRIFLDEGGFLVVNAEFVELTPPLDLTDPWLYGPEFALWNCDLDPLFWVAEFPSEGIYIMRTHNAGRIDTSAVLVGIQELEERAPQEVGEYKKYTPHVAEITIKDRNAQVANSSDFWNGQVGANVKNVQNVAGAIMELCTHFDNNGPLGKITITGHAGKGNIAIGAGDDPVGSDPAKEIGKDADNMTIGAYDAFVKAIGPKMHPTGEICLIGCDPGGGVAGQNLVDCLAKDLGVKASAKRGSNTYLKHNGKVCAYSKSRNDYRVATAKRCVYMMTVTATNCNDCPCDTGDLWCTGLTPISCQQAKECVPTFTAVQDCPNGTGTCTEVFTLVGCMECTPTCPQGDSAEDAQVRDRRERAYRAAALDAGLIR